MPPRGGAGGMRSNVMPNRGPHDHMYQNMYGGMRGGAMGMQSHPGFMHGGFNAPRGRGMQGYHQNGAGRGRGAGGGKFGGIGKPQSFDHRNKMPGASRGRGCTVESQQKE